MKAKYITIIALSALTFAACEDYTEHNFGTREDLYQATQVSTVRLTLAGSDYENLTKDTANVNRALRADVSSPVIIKAFNIATKVDLEAVKPYEGIVDYFLFDTKGPSVGGNGAKFDWTVLADYVGATPFLLSGGIGPDDAARVRNFSHPRCIGIDLNSCFETAPAVKDTAALSRFLSQLSQ